MECPNKCHLWARLFDPNKPLTAHHPNCSHVDDSLIEVWRVHVPGETGGLIVDDETVARSASTEDPDAPLQVTPLKMHREIFDALPEFAGF